MRTVTIKPYSCVGVDAMGSVYEVPPLAIPQADAATPAITNTETLVGKAAVKPSNPDEADQCAITKIVHPPALYGAPTMTPQTERHPTPMRVTRNRNRADERRAKEPWESRCDPPLPDDTKTLRLARTQTPY